MTITGVSNTTAIQEKLSTARANMAANFTVANSACSQAIDLAELERNVAMEAEARHLKAQILFSHGQHVAAVEQMKRAIALREELKDNAKVSISLNGLGIILTELGDFAGALESCFHSLRLKEELNDKRGIATTLINIGSIYQRLGNAEQELNMYERSLKLAVELNDRRLINVNHLNLGVLCTKLLNYEQALQYLNGLDEELIEIGDRQSAISALNSQGTVLYGLGKFEDAIAKYTSCLNLARETGSLSGISNALMNIGEAKIKMGRAQEALAFIKEAIEVAKTNELPVYLKDATHILSDYYASTNDFKNALEEYKQYTHIKDELLNAQNLKQLGELHLKYDLDKKEREAKINHLENVELKQALDRVQVEKNRSDKLLLNILPEEVADELKETGTAKAKYFDSVSVMFIDIKNFTIISERLLPDQLVGELDELFRGFDEIILRYNIEKIKTIGDCYMCAAGLPVKDSEHAVKVAYAALDILSFIELLKQKKHKEGKTAFDVRIGVNSGPVVAGIVGSAKFAYDIWGDTVNTAARMEQSGEVGKINISGNTYALLGDKFKCLHRGKINAKNKGEIDMYFLTEQD